MVLLVIRCMKGDIGSYGKAYIGATVKHNWQSPCGVDASAESCKDKLCHRYEDSANTSLSSEQLRTARMNGLLDTLITNPKDLESTGQRRE